MIRVPYCTAFALAAFLAIATGASCDDAPSPGEAYASQRLLRCEKAHACKAQYPGVDAAFELTWSSDLEGCKRLYGWSGAIGGTIEDQVNQGRVAYDADAAVRCLDGLEATTCDELWSPIGALQEPKACDGVFRPILGAPAE